MKGDVVPATCPCTPVRADRTVLVAALLGGCAGHAIPAPPAPIPVAERRISLFLIGDAGKPDTSGDRVIAELARQAQAAPRGSVILFLGDNLYPRGLPAPEDPERKEMERRLAAQLRGAGRGAAERAPRRLRARKPRLGQDGSRRLERGAPVGGVHPGGESRAGGAGAGWRLPRPRRSGRGRELPPPAPRHRVVAPEGGVPQTPRRRLRMRYLHRGGDRRSAGTAPRRERRAEGDRGGAPPARHGGGAWGALPGDHPSLSAPRIQEMAVAAVAGAGLDLSDRASQRDHLPGPERRRQRADAGGVRAGASGPSAAALRGRPRPHPPGLRGALRALHGGERRGDRESRRSGGVGEGGGVRLRLARLHAARRGSERPGPAVRDGGATPWSP